MKILGISLKNLNSLRGQWTIDLSNKIFENDGIFAITGPTGAGKTTIFDAICLALYGQTPRLGAITENKNEIMSRKTRECFAKVIFEANDKKFISSWAQHFSKTGKKLQTPKHVLSDYKTGEIFSDKTTETRKKIEELIGLDFKRFRQAVMLEQGGFDAFLKADKNERAQILELLTGTEIYSKISMLVYEQFLNEREKLRNIIFLRDSKMPLNNSQSETEILDAIEKIKKSCEEIKTQRNDSQKSLDWLRGVLKLENELREILHEISKLETRRENFIFNSRRLEAAQRAAALLVDFSNLTAQRENYKKICSRVKKLENDIATASELISEIENQQLPGLQSALNELTKNLLDASPEEFHARSKERMSMFSVLAIDKRNIEINKDRANKDFEQAQFLLKAAEDNQAAAQDAYNKALDDYERITSLRAEAIFEAERKKLRPGLPCPICGATEHPRIFNHAEKITSDFRNKNFDDALKLARDKLTAARRKLDEANKRLNLERANESAARTRLDNLVTQFNNLSKKYEADKIEISNLMNKIGVSVKVVQEIIPALENWRAKIKNLNEEIKRAQERREFFNAKISDNKNSLSQERSELAALKHELEEAEAEFQNKLREKNFDNEDAFRASILEQEEIERLLRLKNEIENEQTRLIGIKDNTAAKLEIEKSKNLTSKPLDQLELEIKNLEKKFNDLLRQSLSFEHELEDRKKLQAEIAELNHQYEIQEKIFSNWAALNELIGSAKGDKFRVFAQKITLSMMIELANAQLERMSGRYVLMARPESEGLELSVLDKEQAGEIRPTENLSGGEKFIISLALALGLSQISGKKSRIDSLFLDEGFGSLDDEALSMALEALGEVRRSGRMIGIISHVQALRERIAAQINVIPQREGVSIIEGPGVSYRKST